MHWSDPFFLPFIVTCLTCSSWPVHLHPGLACFLFVHICYWETLWCPLPPRSPVSLGTQFGLISRSAVVLWQPVTSSAPDSCPPCLPHAFPSPCLPSLTVQMCSVELDRELGLGSDKPDSHSSLYTSVWDAPSPPFPRRCSQATHSSVLAGSPGHSLSALCQAILHVVVTICLPMSYEHWRAGLLHCDTELLAQGQNIVGAC